MSTRLGDPRTEVEAGGGPLRLPCVPPGVEGLLRHDGVTEGEPSPGVLTEALRELGRRLLERDGVDRVLEVEGRNPDDQVSRHVVEIGELVDESRLELHLSFALAVDGDAIARNPTNALLEIDEADIGVLLGFPAPVQSEGQKVEAVLVGHRLAIGSGEPDVLNLVEPHNLGPALGLEQDDTACSIGARA